MFSLNLQPLQVGAAEQGWISNKRTNQCPLLITQLLCNNHNWLHFYSTRICSMCMTKIVLCYICLYGSEEVKAFWNSQHHNCSLLQNPNWNCSYHNILYSSHSIMSNGIKTSVLLHKQNYGSVLLICIFVHPR